MRQPLLVTVVVAALALAPWLSPARAGHEKPVPFSTAEWKTNFARHSVPLEEIISGGPPRDGIPAIEAPRFDTVAAGDRWLKAREPVILFQRGGEVRAYPLQILIWHEIVNDTVAGRPVAITFCPLCNTAIAFDRRLGGRGFNFGTTGKLRFSDLVMYDRQTESWWQQVTGEAIAGDLTGRRLTFLPAQIISWDTFRRHLPQGKVLNRDTGHARPYGRNPYTGYDDVNSSPFLYTDTVGGRPIVVIFERGVASALDQGSIADSRDVGTAAVF